MANDSHANAFSRVTLGSIKSKAEVLPSTRACPNAASWFTVPHAVIKTLLCLFSLILLSLMFSWESEGIKIFNLNESSSKINYRNPIYCYLGVAFLTVLYTFVMTGLGCSGFNFPPLMQAIVSGIYLFVWLIASPFISASLDTLGHTRLARDIDLNILVLKVANGFGFGIIVLFALDILLAFMTLREVAMGQELTECKSAHSVASYSYSKHIIGRGSYRHRQSSLPNKAKDPMPVILKEGTPII